jgi:hypothetical protein
MKELASFSTTAEAQIAAGLLEEAGIPCEMREAALEATGWIGPGEMLAPSVWILRDEDLSAAEGVLAPAQPSNGSAWSCPACHSENEAPFDACWSCGTARS